MSTANSIRFAFRADAVAGLDAAGLAALAARLGYEGVELRGLPQSDIADTRKAFASAGIAIAAVGSDLVLDAPAGRSADELKKLIDAAGSLACATVRIADAPISRKTPAEIGTALGRRLFPFAELAADRGVRIAIDNAMALRRARDLWVMLEDVNHPALGACIDPVSSLLAGETPALVVPVLNQRILHVQVRDASLANPPQPKPLGQGEARLADLCRRLRGIGYRGWVTVALEGSLKETAEQSLAEAFATLKGWLRPEPPAPAPKKAAPAAAPAAAAAAK